VQYRLELFIFDDNDYGVSGSANCSVSTPWPSPEDEKETVDAVLSRLIEPTLDKAIAKLNIKKGEIEDGKREAV